jgi:hypothetical protein
LTPKNSWKKEREKSILEREKEEKGEMKEGKMKRLIWWWLKGGDYYLTS